MLYVNVFDGITIVCIQISYNAFEKYIIVYYINILLLIDVDLKGCPWAPLNSKAVNLEPRGCCIDCKHLGCSFRVIRGEITPLSSSYNISGLVPVCWLLFQCF